MKPGRVLSEAEILPELNEDIDIVPATLLGLRLKNGGFRLLQDALMDQIKNPFKPWEPAFAIP